VLSVVVEGNEKCFFVLSVVVEENEKGFKLKES